MDVQAFAIDPITAQEALHQYQSHRTSNDKLDREIERIYKAISKGSVVIDALDAIRRAGLDEQKRPKLAICEAHASAVRCQFDRDHITFGIRQEHNIWMLKGKLQVDWPGVGYQNSCAAILPRIPPQHRPTSGALSNYHLLWEADWTDIPSDPYLLRRIGKDAWVVLAEWDLTAVEISVLRAHRAKAVRS